MVRLTGLDVESFMHPDEKSAWRAVQTKWLKKLLDWVNNYETKVELQNQLLANAFRVTRQDMPELYGIVEEACNTLDFEPIPQIYTMRSRHVGVHALYGNVPVLVFPDFILNDFDEGMLRYEAGCGIASMKSNGQIRTALRCLLPMLKTVPLFGDAAVVPLANWLRMATFTEDRGGLLACQDIGAVRRRMMRGSGLPSRLIDENQYPAYIRCCEDLSGLVGVAQAGQTLFRTVPWNKDRAVELFKWYSSGAYDDLLEEFE